MVSLIVLLKNKAHPVKILLKRTRGLLNKNNSFLEFSTFGVFCMILYSLGNGELLVTPLGLFSSLLSFSLCFVYPVVSFSFLLSPCVVCC
jgi:hypothetical protein